ncbi:Cyanobacterial phytochrome B [Bradyrhizobium sp. ORS 375]|uniref:ATP-binding protein n=1 Tax=Bradyrhizobium sp. (strain ORS 375) TaxID=566679 RepID=UPI000240860E|nr:ATP-binding protein [Bradyrhizobium sp. ORS 375]CCD95820.1 Cyanobacterial phytochrome B [Bradyrhizobium sp. ORS 375]
MGAASNVAASNVDLSNCDRELIQYPGAIQPHGVLLVVGEPSHVVLQVSANVETFLGRSQAEVVGRPLAQVFAASGRQLIARIERATLESDPAYILREAFAGQSGDVNIFAHRSDGVLLIELEKATEPEQPLAADLYSPLRTIISRLQATPTLQAFFDTALEEVRAFTGYDRVLAYQFADDGSGHVIAEARQETLEPYLGLHYPASDIPAPARRMFGLGWLRHLPDADYTPVPLVPELHPETGQPIDLSYSILRSVSVMYSQYLKNMGVHSTMVMPLMKAGKLWGLISAMHHAGPRHVPYERRMAAEFLAHMLSLLMASKEDGEHYEARLRMRSVTELLAERLMRSTDIHEALAGDADGGSLLDQVDAAGGAIVTDGRVTLLGETPLERDVKAIVDWLYRRPDQFLAFDELGKDYQAATALRALASGLLAIRLSSRKPEFLLWFRPEQVQEVTWAGDPSKPVEIDEQDGMLRLRPRNSFAQWKESVAGRSRPWLEHEREAAQNLGRALLDVRLTQLEKIEKANRELTELNTELDSFAYAASHDLKEPMRGIHHLATYLRRGLDGVLTDDARQQLDTIKKLARRMDDLIEALLSYSQTGRAELAIEQVDLDQLVDEVLLACRERLAETATQVRRSRSLGLATCDRVRLREVFSNLIGNALKYNDKPSRWIEIGYEDGTPRRYFVRDNGIGLAAADQSRIFQIFRRLHGRDEFGGGSGAGLTIARRTVERHGGRMWVVSSSGRGASFYFTLEAEEQP